MAPSRWPPPPPPRGSLGVTSVSSILLGGPGTWVRAGPPADCVLPPAGVEGESPLLVPGQAAYHMQVSVFIPKWRCRRLCGTGVCRDGRPCLEGLKGRKSHEDAWGAWLWGSVCLSVKLLGEMEYGRISREDVRGRWVGRLVELVTVNHVSPADADFGEPGAGRKPALSPRRPRPRSPPHRGDPQMLPSMHPPLTRASWCRDKRLRRLGDMLSYALSNGP